MLCIVVVVFLNYLSLFGAEWSSMFLHHCSLEPMCLSSAWLTDLVHVKSHWPILGRLQGSVGRGHNLWYTVRAFRLLDYDFVLAAVTKIEVMLYSSLKLLRVEIILGWFFWWQLFNAFYSCFNYRRDEGGIPMKSTALNLDLFSYKYDYVEARLNSVVLGYGL